MARFGRVLSAMVTPFDSDGALDLDAAVVLARYLQDHGNDGLVVAGTTGEAPTLNDDERLSLFAAVIEAVTHPGHRRYGHQRHSALGAPHQGGRGARRGGRARRVPVLQPSVAGRHRGPHARRSPAPRDLPVMVYDIPIRTGRKINTGDAAADVPRGAQHRGAEGRRRQPRRDGGA